MGRMPVIVFCRRVRSSCKCLVFLLRHAGQASKENDNGCYLPGFVVSAEAGHPGHFEPVFNDPEQMTVVPFLLHMT